MLAAAGVTAAACGIPGESGPKRISRDSEPFTVLATTTTTTTTTTTLPVITPTTVRLERVDVFLVRSDRIERTIRHLPQVPEPTGLVRLLEVPTASEAARGLRSALPGSGAVLEVSLGGGIATVNLGSELTEVPSGDQILAFAQITYTLTTLPGVGLVAFQLEGAPIDVPGPDGSIREGPVSRDTYRELTSSPVA